MTGEIYPVVEREAKEVLLIRWGSNCHPSPPPPPPGFAPPQQVTKEMIVYLVMLVFLSQTERYIPSID